MFSKGFFLGGGVVENQDCVVERYTICPQDGHKKQVIYVTNTMVFTQHHIDLGKIKFEAAYSF